MEIISIPKLTLGQLQDLTNRSVEIATSIGAVSSELAVVEQAFDTFKQGMQKDQAASDKASLDRTRDTYVSGLFFDIKAEEYFPHTSEEVLKAVEQLKGLSEKYGFKISRLSYDEETTSIDNMLAELDKIDLSSLDKISRWKAEIVKANEAFKAGAKTFLDERVSASDKESASAAAPELLDALDNLYTMLFAHAKISADETIINGYVTISTLVKSYR